MSVKVEGPIYAGVAQLVERNLAKVEVVGSNPIARSNSNVTWSCRRIGIHEPIIGHDQTLCGLWAIWCSHWASTPALFRRGVRFSQSAPEVCCGAVRKRACARSRRSWVQIPPAMQGDQAWCGNTMAIVGRCLKRNWVIAVTLVNSKTYST